MRIAAAAVLLLLAGCAGAGNQPPAPPLPAPPPAPGIRLTVEGPVVAAPGHHLVMGELVLPPGAPVPRHRHSGEEFVTVLEGSVTLHRDGMADVVLTAGQGVRIAPGVPHSASAGPQGLRAVSSWIVVDGQPLREALPE
jgi:quercetin dioxygenase-like cupin family protein